MGWADEKTDIEKLTDICLELASAITVDSDHAGATATALTKITELQAEQAKKRIEKLTAISDYTQQVKNLAELK